MNFPDLPPLHPPKRKYTIKNSPRRGITSYVVSSTSRSKANIIDKTLMFPIVALTPKFILPNYITILRFILIPVVVTLLLFGKYESGLIVFIIAALTDAWDGAIARTRGQITDWGKLFDPLADKLLIGAVAVIMVLRFLHPIIAILMIIIEIWLILYNIFFLGRKKKIVSARLEGKIKMILQCVGVGLVLLFAIVEIPWLLTAATVILSIAIFFGGLSMFVYKTI